MPKEHLPTPQLNPARVPAKLAPTVSGANVDGAEGADVSAAAAAGIVTVENVVTGHPAPKMTAWLPLTNVVRAATAIQ